MRLRNDRQEDDRILTGSWLDMDYSSMQWAREPLAPFGT